MSEWSAIPDRAASLEEQYERAKNRLEQTFNNIIRAVEDAKIKKMSELEDGRHQQEQAIEELYRKMNLNEARVNDALRYAFISFLRLLFIAASLDACLKKLTEWSCWLVVEKWFNS